MTTESNRNPDDDDLDYGPEPTDLDTDAPEDDAGQDEENLDEEPESDPDGGEDEDDFSIEIEGEEPARESSAMRQLREAHRQQARELAALKAAQQPKTQELGKKPDLWDDCDGDGEEFEKQLTAWHERKAAAQAQAAAAERAAEEAAAAWAAVEQGYTAKAAALGVPKFQELQQRVEDALHPDLLRAVKFYMADPAKVVAALGSNPRLLERITAEQDPIKALFALRDVEGKINVKRKPPKPEANTIPRGSAPVSAASADKHLQRLEAAADKSGDRTALIAYKRQLAAKGK